MTYPRRDDYETQDEYDAACRRERARREDAAADDLESTGVCTLRVLPADPVTVSCTVCRHATTLHPGWHNPDPDLTGCVVCHIKLLATGSRALRPHRRALERRGERPLCCPDWPICSH